MFLLLFSQDFFSLRLLTFTDVTTFLSHTHSHINRETVAQLATTSDAQNYELRERKDRKEGPTKSKGEDHQSHFINVTTTKYQKISSSHHHHSSSDHFFAFSLSFACSDSKTDTTREEKHFFCNESFSHSLLLLLFSLRWWREKKLK